MECFYYKLKRLRFPFSFKLSSVLKAKMRSIKCAKKCRRNNLPWFFKANDRNSRIFLLQFFVILKSFDYKVYKLKEVWKLTFSLFGSLFSHTAGEQLHSGPQFRATLLQPHVRLAQLPLQLQLPSDFLFIVNRSLAIRIK